MRKILLFGVLGLSAVEALGMGRTPPETQTATPQPAVVQKKGGTMTEPVKGVSEWKGQFCSVSVPYVVVLNNIDEWKKLWADTFKKDAPEVDWANNVAGAVFLGSKSTGGYGVEFLEPESKDGVMWLQWHEKSPAAGGMVIQAFTQPWAIKLFPRPSGAVTIEQRSK